MKVSPTGIFGVLKRNGLSRLPRGAPKRSPSTFKRYEQTVPGHQVQIDVKFLFLRDKANRRIRRYQIVELHLKLTQVLHLKVAHLEEPEYGSSVLGFSSFCLLGFLRRAVFEAVAIVAGCNDVAVMSQPVE